MNTWLTIERTFADLKARGKKLNRRTRFMRNRIALLQAEGPGEVDDAHAGLHERRRELRGGRIGQREEHDVGACQRRVQHVDVHA